MEHVPQFENHWSTMKSNILWQLHWILLTYKRKNNSLTLQSLGTFIYIHRVTLKFCRLFFIISPLFILYLVTLGAGKLLLQPQLSRGRVMETFCVKCPALQRVSHLEMGRVTCQQVFTVETLFCSVEWKTWDAGQKENPASLVHPFCRQRFCYSSSQFLFSEAIVGVSLLPMGVPL